jgi:formylglycine-generating enzyme required for sulfatase activity
MPVASRPLIERLINVRLLLRDERKAARDDNATVVEIAHEALLRQWKPLAGWLDEEFSNLKSIEAIKRAAAEWNKKKSEAWLLHRGERLGTAEAMQQRPDLGRLLGVGDAMYLNACRALEEARREEREAAYQRELKLQKDRTEAEQARAQEAERARDAEAKRAEAADSSRRRQRYFSLALVIVFVGAWITTWLWEKGYNVEQAVLKLRSVFVDIQLEPAMQTIPAGEYKKAFIKKFAIGKFEITFEEYDRFAIDMNMQLPSDAGWGRGRQPVINVDWYDAKAYAEWLSKHTGKRYRLPTNIEWEYAAQSGGRQDVWAGTSTEARLKEYAVYYVYANRPALVGSKIPNDLGLYDMSGNVAEWTKGCLELIKDKCNQVAQLGGSWGSGPHTMELSMKGIAWPDNRSQFSGFRLAQDLD